MNPGRAGGWRRAVTVIGVAWAVATLGMAESRGALGRSESPQRWRLGDIAHGGFVLSGPPGWEWHTGTPAGVTRRGRTPFSTRATDQDLICIADCAAVAAGADLAGGVDPFPRPRALGVAGGALDQLGSPASRVEVVRADAADDYLAAVLDVGVPLRLTAVKAGQRTVVAETPGAEVRSAASPGGARLAVRAGLSSGPLGSPTKPKTFWLARDPVTGWRLEHQDDTSPECLSDTGEAVVRLANGETALRRSDGESRPVPAVETCVVGPAGVFAASFDAPDSGFLRLDDGLLPTLRWTAYWADAEGQVVDQFQMDARLVVLSATQQHFAVVNKANELSVFNRKAEKQRVARNVVDAAFVPNIGLVALYPDGTTEVIREDRLP